MEQNKLINEKELLHYAECTVKRYSYAIPASEIEDVAMEIVAGFLDQEEKITANFREDSKWSTYLYAVLNRMCCTIIRKESSRWKHHSNLEVDANQVSSNHHTTDKKLLLDDEATNLKYTIQLSGESSKTFVFFAFYYLLPPKKHLLENYDKYYKENKLFELLIPKENSLKSILFDTLALAVQRVEKKSVKSDAVRMWFRKKEGIIITRLNGKRNRANYNSESLRLLFEYYYEGIRKKN